MELVSLVALICEIRLTKFNDGIFSTWRLGDQGA